LVCVTNNDGDNDDDNNNYKNKFKSVKLSLVAGLRQKRPITKPAQIRK